MANPTMRGGHGGTGRPSKGPRLRATTRLPVQLHVAASKQAKRQGITLSEWLEQAVERELAKA